MILSNRHYIMSNKENWVIQLENSKDKIQVPSQHFQPWYCAASTARGGMHRDKGNKRSSISCWAFLSTFQRQWVGLLQAMLQLPYQPHPSSSCRILISSSIISFLMTPSHSSALPSSHLLACWQWLEFPIKAVILVEKGADMINVSRWLKATACISALR